MKKIIVIMLLVVFNLAHAQKLVGIKGGMNIANYINNYSGGMDNTRDLNSFHAGIVANVPFLLFSFQSAMLVTGKGAQVTYGDVNSPNYYVAKSNPMYLEIPFTLNINPKLGERTGLFVGAGPYIAMGIGGRNSVYGRKDGTYFSHDQKIIFTNDDPTTPVEEGAAYGKLKRFDYGVTVNAGVIIHGIMLSGFYDLGLVKVNSLSNNNQSDNYRNMTVGLSAGFMFGGKQN